MGRNLIDSVAARNNKGRENIPRPKSEKFRTSSAPNELYSASLIQKNLEDYISNLSNLDLKQKIEQCPGNLGDCPLINDFQRELKKSLSNHVNVGSKNDPRLCKTSRVRPTTKDRNPEMETLKSNENFERRRMTDVKAATSSTSKGVIRSTRAQDLRSQSNRDLLKPKTTNEKTRMESPYVSALAQKKKKPSSMGNPDTKFGEDKKKQTKAEGRKKVEGIPLQRQRTQEIINPKMVKKTSSGTAKKAGGDFESPGLKRSQTFFICKGTKNGGGDKWKDDDTRSWNECSEVQSDGNVTEDDIPSPKLKPLTHKDSFCLIVKSSQKWAQKNRSDDEKWLRYGLACHDKTKKTSDKGILKNSSYDLKSVDSLEKVDSEKIVRFSDELSRNKRVLKKLVRRKKRLQNFLTPSWYQKNKMFQKYLQVLKEKSVLLSDAKDGAEDGKPVRVPVQLKERYEAEMLGLCPRKGKSVKNHTKDAYSY